MLMVSIALRCQGCGVLTPPSVCSVLFSAAPTSIPAAAAKKEDEERVTGYQAFLREPRCLPGSLVLGLQRSSCQASEG